MTRNALPHQPAPRPRFARAAQPHKDDQRIVFASSHGAVEAACERDPLVVLSRRGLSGQRGTDPYGSVLIRAIRGPALSATIRWIREIRGHPAAAVLHDNSRMHSSSSRLGVLALVAVSIALLLPGIFLPVLTIRGVITPEGVAQMAPVMLDKGLDQGTVDSLKAMMNPAVISLMQVTGRDLKKTIIETLGPRLAEALKTGVGEVEVYTQTRSIMGAVRNLYEVGSPIPATLILLFSVVVPVTKALLVVMAAFMRDVAARQRVLDFVASIAKWSMADVFVVGLFITYLAAQATQTVPGQTGNAPLLAFDAHFRAGFYWFAAYCLFSLASQQYTARLARQP